MELYVITANTYHEGWGAEISLFGVCDNEDDLNKIVDKVRKRGHIPDIKKVNLNRFKEIYLGGYIE